MFTILIALFGQVASSSPGTAPADRVVLTEDYQVLQRDAKERASCVVVVPKEVEGTTFVVTIEDQAGNKVRQTESTAIELEGARRGVSVEDLEVGGPYTITITAKDNPAATPVRFQRILVGDIWILGGQSNMFGIDRIKEELPELPYLNMLNVLHFQRDSHWCSGVPPIHRIPPSNAPFVIKRQHPEYSDAQVQSVLASNVPVGGIDCSYFFARKLHGDSGVPIGLIPCAIGGALAIWDPQDRAKNRYGFLHHQVMRAGGRVKGMLFFQGEQDAIFGDKDQTETKPSLIGPVSKYGQQFKEFVESLRKDVQNPDMPVIFAQICRHHNSPEGRAWGWESVRDAQRRLPEYLPHSHCVPSIDLDVIDGLHLDYDSLKRMGERMARLALQYSKHGVPPRSEIRVESVTAVKSPLPRIAVKFSGVTGRLRAPGRPTGFVFKKSTGEALDSIFKVELDPARPDSVILWTTGAPSDVALYYGAGTAPYVNIVDDDDMPLPAFGPIALE